MILSCLRLLYSRTTRLIEIVACFDSHFWHPSRKTSYRLPCAVLSMHTVNDDDAVVDFSCTRLLHLCSCPLLFISSPFFSRSSWRSCIDLSSLDSLFTMRYEKTDEESDNTWIFIQVLFLTSTSSSLRSSLFSKWEGVHMTINFARLSAKRTQNRHCLDIPSDVSSRVIPESPFLTWRLESKLTRDTLKWWRTW